MMMMYKIFLAAVISMASYSLSPTNVFTPPKWEGHWEAYSTVDPQLKVASVDIAKLKGKEYSYKLWIKSDFNGTGDACTDKEFEGVATYNGANGLNSNTQGLGFVYYQESGLISLYHDYSNQEIIDMGLCFSADKMKKMY